MSKKERDEERREIHIERRREAGIPRADRTRRNARTSTKRRIQTNVQKTTTEPTTSLDEFSQKMSTIKNELINLNFRTKNLPSRLSQLDNYIKEIPNRMSNIESNGYHIPSNTENISKELSEQWINASQGINEYISEQTRILLSRHNELDMFVNRASSINDLSKYDYQLANLNRDLSLVESSLNSRLDTYQSQYSSINSTLKRAEDTLSNLSNTSINLKNSEYPLIAIEATDLTNDKKGILTLTNQRVLFEEVKSEVLKKTLFFETERKTTREVTLDHPVGSIESIEKGRVGFFKGAGLYIKFKPEIGVGEIKIDTRNNDDDELINKYNYVMSGQAEIELDPNKEEGDKIAPVFCPNCSAPYTEEIYKGQTSLKCKYCNTVIKL
jgi:hypothetical protein